MGEIIKFTCSHCGHDEIMNIGVGMHWDIEKIFNGIVDRVKRGEYGEEWKKELQKDRSLVLNISDEIYICPTCGYFTTGLNLSLYKPLEKTLFTRFRRNKKYGTDLTLESNPDFQLYKTYPHLCAKCNEQMLIRNPRKNNLLPTCPKCGEKGQLFIDTLWD